MKRVINLLKRIPIDLGQGAVAETTEGKQIALRLVPPGDGRAVLDLGARAGHQSRWLASRGYTVTSVDVEPGFEGCLVIDANQPLPFEDDSFDLIWSSEVIEHLADPAFSLSELRRVTRPGGSLILTTPNSYMWLFRMLSWVGLTPDKLQRDDHLHFFDLDDIRRLAPEAELYGYFPYMWVKRQIERPSLVGHLSPTFVLKIDVPL
ncbi:MAG: class I SAM-dependent methyltransferase [Bradymonadia bacterium]